MGKYNRPGQLANGREAVTRIERLRERLQRREHARYRTTKHLSVLRPDGKQEPLVIRKAQALALVLREMPVFIQDDELIVGGRTIYGPHVDSQRSLFWDRSSIFPGLAEAMNPTWYPEYATPEEAARVEIQPGSASNHTVLGYCRVLKLGFGGLREEAEARMRTLAADPHLSAEERQHREDFLRAVVITMDGATSYALRLASLAEQLAAAEQRLQRRLELREIAACCRAVSQRAPQIFRQAIQLFFLARVVSVVENYTCMPLGRFDQYLYPFLAADLERGSITREDAQELVECLFIKLNEEVDVTSTDDCLRIMLGGQKADGSDATNDLTFMCFRACLKLRLADPKVGVRLHRGTPPELLSLCVEGIKSGLGGLPELYNDEVIIPTLRELGIPLADAREYTHDGCAEPIIGGKSDFYPTWTSVRFLGILLDMLAEGQEPGTFDDLLTGYLRRVEEKVRDAVADGNRRDRELAFISPTPFLSATLEGCVAKALDKTEGGTLYNHTGLLGCELPDAANSLAAIKQVVYEDKDVSLSELRRALADNFVGHERLRLRLLNRAPKYGNDDDRVDEIATRIAEVFCREGSRHTNPRGGRYLPGFHNFGGFILWGRQMGARPDGRRAGEPTAIHLSPATGTDRRGPTAVIRSMAKVTRLHPPLGTMLELKLHPSALVGPAGEAKLLALIRGFTQLDGFALQFNVVDASTLRAAQRQPDAYRGLLVRVWGFSAYFVELAADVQESIIARTEHAL